MIEGLQHLPWLQRQLRDDKNSVAHLADCGKCKQMTTTVIRQSMGCGYEPAHPGIEPRPWSHAGFSGEQPKACPGFTTKLPEVIEIARVRMHAKNGMARDFLGGDATENVLRGIEILEGSDGEASCWRPKDSGQ